MRWPFILPTRFHVLYAAVRPDLALSPRLLEGAVISLQIAVLAFCGGLLIGTLCAAIRSFGPRWLARIVGVYVVFFTNTPQLVQIYFLYFALPDSGILLSSFAAVVIGMTLNAVPISPRSSARASRAAASRRWRRPR